MSNDERSGSSSSEPSNKMQNRVSGGRLAQWILMEADRRGVAVLLVGAVFVGLLVLGARDPAVLSNTMRNADPTSTLFQALTGAIITGVTLVVTLAQLVLSQELGPAGDQQNRMEGAMDFRNDSAEVLNLPVAPPEPAAYLRALVHASERQAENVMIAVDEADEPSERVADAHASVRSYAHSLIENAREVREQLKGAQFGTFSVVSAALNYNYSWKIYEARKLKRGQDEEGAGSAMSDDVRERLGDLLEVLRLFGPAREHIKTLYFEWTLAELSRSITYAAVPALVVAMGSLLYLGTPAPFGVPLLGIDGAVWVVSLAASIAVLPFGILLSYMMRIVTVAKHTLAIGPFVLRETNRTADIDT